jgi:hypothetical protein
MNPLRCCATCLLAAALGCQKSEPPSQPVAASPPPAAAAPAVPAAKPAETPVATALPLKLESVPAREDFEEEAESQITPANLERELKALEQEVSSD